MADNMPDFDKMSPEELMLWMESLAKRQGATEGMTTSADLQIAEIDPDTVTLDEPGYVPSEGKSKGQAVLPPTRAKQPTPAPEPVAPSPPAPAVEPAASIERPVLEPLALDEAEVETQVSEPVAAQSAMAWLESLAADQGDLPELDLSGLGADIQPTALEPAKSDPIAWLEGLTESQGESAPVTSSVEVGDPFATNIDPMNWLESLAKRQGAKGEELRTEADLNIPAPDSILDSGPGYTDYSVDAPMEDSADTVISAAKVTEPDVLDPSELESPADWLDSLASGQGFTTKPAEKPEEEEAIPSDDKIREALRSGHDISPQDMEAWFNKQLDRGFEREEPELPDEDEEALPEFDPDAPAIPAALPDWLSEMAPATPAPPPPNPTEQQAFIEQIVEPPTVPDMPDWLKEEVGAHSDLDLDSIFASTESAAEAVAPALPPTPPAVAAGEIEVDHSDPWVEAFDHEQGIITLSDAPPAPPAAKLEEAELEPEEELAAGQPESVPDWMSETPVAVEEEVIEPGEMPDWLHESAPDAAPVSTDEMPDWLKEVGAEVEPHEIPDWLKETADTEEQPAVPAPAPAAATVTTVAPVSQPAPATAISPVPVPLAVALSDTEAATVLNNARGQVEANVDAGLLEYEKLVRANARLDDAVNDLSALVKKHEKNPAVYRVLGDGLMRTGQLQAALDTYRKALNLL